MALRFAIDQLRSPGVQSSQSELILFAFVQGPVPLKVEPRTASDVNHGPDLNHEPCPNDNSSAEPEEQHDDQREEPQEEADEGILEDGTSDQDSPAVEEEQRGGAELDFQPLYECPEVDTEAPHAPSETQDATDMPAEPQADQDPEDVIIATDRDVRPYVKLENSDEAENSGAAAPEEEEYDEEPYMGEDIQQDCEGDDVPQDYEGDDLPQNCEGYDLQRDFEGQDNQETTDGNDEPASAATDTNARCDHSAALSQSVVLERIRGAWGVVLVEVATACLSPSHSLRTGTRNQSQNGA
jgi:hypothetical protein